MRAGYRVGVGWARVEFYRPQIEAADLNLFLESGWMGKIVFLKQLYASSFQSGIINRLCLNREIC
jgi:hypothetical protein